MRSLGDELFPVFMRQELSDTFIMDIIIGGNDRVLDTTRASVLDTAWDWYVGGKDNAYDYIERFYELEGKSAFFWCIENNEIVGVFGFILHPVTGEWETTAFLMPEFREGGFNVYRLILSITAFQKLKTKLYASIRKDNKRSKKALQKLYTLGLPKDARTVLFEQWRDNGVGAECYVYELTLLDTTDLYVDAKHLRTVYSGLFSII